MATASSAGVLTETLLADQLCAVVESLQRSTVHVRSGRAGAGSGVIWRPDGLIVTNAHVAQTSRPTVELWDGRTLDGEVIARDPARDLAALTIPAGELPAVAVGDSDRLRVGQMVTAVGNPLGLSGALTVGIVHAIAPAAGQGRQRWVQADVRLAPGNSGGPLADIEGRVIGINSMVAGGLGIAVPSNTVRRFLSAGSERPRLGVTTQPVAAPIDGTTVPGLLVLEVAEGSPAEEAGVLLGDIIVGVAGRRFTAPDDLSEALHGAGAGGRVVLDIVRGGRAMALAVTLHDAKNGGTAGKEAA